MNHVAHLLITLTILTDTPAQEVKRNIPYADPAHERQVLDVYSQHQAKNLPVVFWIHGGGWQTGDKTSVQIRAKVFVDNRFVEEHALLLSAPTSVPHRTPPHPESTPP